MDLRNLSNSLKRQRATFIRQAKLSTFLPPFILVEFQLPARSNELNGTNLILLKALLHSTRRDTNPGCSDACRRNTKHGRGNERKLVEGDAKKHDNTITSRRSPLTRWIYRQVTGEQLTPNFWRVVSPTPPHGFRVPIVRRPFRHAGQIHVSSNDLFIRHYSSSRPRLNSWN